MSEDRTPTPRGISALLREAGFVAAGRYRDDEGYRATWAHDSPTSVCVRFHAADDWTFRGLISSAALVLAAYGYAVETDTRTPRLIVTTKAAQPGRLNM